MADPTSPQPSPSRAGGPERERTLGRLIPNPKLRFLDQCREVMRFKRFSPRTIEAYVHWTRQFILWSGKRHPKDLGGPEVRALLPS